MHLFVFKKNLQSHPRERLSNRLNIWTSSKGNFQMRLLLGMRQNKTPLGVNKTLLGVGKTLLGVGKTLTDSKHKDDAEQLQ